MAKRRYTKGNLDRSDYDRVVLTDTPPAELPIVVSNDGFYENLRTYSFRSNDAKSLIDALLQHPNQRFTIPYRYRVAKDALSTRRLSLLHPGAQKSVCRFYESYSDLICSYNSRSSFSIRAPIKHGSSYFFRTTDSEKNKFKKAGVDTLEFEKRTRNPSSYFAYYGYERKHQFFSSNRYSRLEKKYPVMWMGDVSKCFDSIYTHSVSWALKSMPFSKRTINMRSFGSEFDSLMQKMNYNETSGICIGPEVSRIFAETIFQSIDVDVEKCALEIGYKNKSDYECLRYVDDLIIFARDESIAAQIYSLFEVELGKYNLHLNDLKLTKLQRPFQTDKSWVIQKLLARLRAFQDQVSERKPSPSGMRLAPRHIFRPQSLKLHFLDEIKSVCREVGVGYDQVANYLIASLVNRLEDTLEAYNEFSDEERPPDSDYIAIVHMLLELSFHYYTLHPTVNSSFRVAKGIVVALEFMDRRAAPQKTFLIEQVVRWTDDLVKSFRQGTQNLVTNRVPIEVINIILAIGPHDDGLNISPDFLLSRIFNEENTEYFSVVSLLFFAASKPAYQEIIDKLARDISNAICSRQFDPSLNSHDAHLFMDLLGCPHLTKAIRSELLNEVWTKKLNLGAIGKVRRLNLIEEIEANPWFVKWSEINLLNLIRRKELSHVY